jgi:ribonuclease P protein component
MKEEYRIKNNLEFEDILNNGKKIKNSFFIIYYKEKKLNNSRFGITLSKKFGNAVERNKYKRIIREIVRKNYFSFKNDCDYIIIIRKEAKNSKYQEMKDNLINLIK